MHRQTLDFFDHVLLDLALFLLLLLLVGESDLQNALLYQVVISVATLHALTTSLVSLSETLVL